MSSNKKDYDVVVIGTGMGGSAAGAISALHGLKTLILEKNPRPGGSCSYYERDGFKVDTGAHMFIRGNKGPFGKLTKRLGMGTPIKFIKAKNTMEFRGLNMDVVVPKNMLMRALAGPKLAWQSKINPMHYPSILRLFGKIAFMRSEEIESLNGVTIDEFVAKYTKNPEVRSMLGGFMGICHIVTPWEASAGECIWNLQRLGWENNLGYPKGGCVTIPETFLKGAEKHGAQVRLKAGVKKIEVKDGQVDCVILENGEKVTTKAVISTSSVKDTILKMTGEDYFPKEYVEKTKNLTPAFTAVQAKIGLKKKLAKAGCLVGGTPIKCTNKVMAEYTDVAFKNAMNGIQGDYIPVYAPVPTNFDPDLAPPGCQIITAVALAPCLDVELKDTHQSWVDGLMRTLNAMLPNLEENIMFCDTWTIETLASWIGKSDGAAYSTGQTVNQVGVKRPSHQTPVKGLYMAGDNAGMARGVGTELACQSGMDCGDIVAHDFANFLI